MSEAPTRVPKLRGKSDPRELLTLDPVERVVFPRVDGSLTESELAFLCGLDEETTRQAVGRLASRGLVELAELPPPRTSETRRAAAAAQSIAPFPDASELPPPVDEIDIEPPLRQRINALYATLDEVDHYAVLGVPRDADRKAIKSAYFDAAAAFHPDRYFRKRLGAFKAKMEAIFSRVTVAHDVLTDRDQRSEYDAYLGERLTARGIEEMLREGLAEIAAVEAEVEEAASSDDAIAAATPASPASIPPEAPPRALPPPPTRATPASTAQARRDILARRLLGGRAPPPRPSGTVPAVRTPANATDDAVESLRRRYQERVEHARSFQAQKYAATAEEAMAKGDAIAASNAYRVAVGMAPGDPALKAKLDAAQRRADEILGESYTRQANYEEKMGNFTAAAQSWKKVMSARPHEAECHNRAAMAMLKSSGDLHEAARYAQRAVALDGTSTDYRVTLANVYIAAGLSLNAKRELEAAAQLAPADDTIRSLLKKVTKP